MLTKFPAIWLPRSTETRSKTLYKITLKSILISSSNSTNISRCIHSHEALRLHFCMHLLSFVYCVFRPSCPKDGYSNSKNETALISCNATCKLLLAGCFFLSPQMKNGMDRATHNAFQFFRRKYLKTKKCGRYSTLSNAPLCSHPELKSVTSPQTHPINKPSAFI